jgi:hypothetical protein
LEVTPQSMQQMMDHGKEELVEGTFIQNESTMIQLKDYCLSSNALLKSIFEKFRTNI